MRSVGSAWIQLFSQAEPTGGLVLRNAPPSIKRDQAMTEKIDGATPGATPGATRCNAGATSKTRRYTLAATKPGRNPDEIGTTWLVQRWCNAGASGVPHPPNTPRGLVRPRGDTPRSTAPFYENNLRTPPGSQNQRLRTALRFSAGTETLARRDRADGGVPTSGPASPV